MAFTSKVRGYDVKFPYPKPYGSQLAVMSSLVRSAERGENGLLESPTGSGKTLALLCSSLAWLEACRVQAKRGEEKALFSPSVLLARQQFDLMVGTPQKVPTQTPVANLSSTTTNTAMVDVPAFNALYVQAGAQGLQSNQQSDALLSNNGVGAADRDGHGSGTESDEGEDSNPFVTPPPSANGKRMAGPRLVISAPKRQRASKNDKTTTTTTADDASVSLDESESRSELPHTRRPRFPRIYYATRTHSQLAQVVNELRRCGYVPNMVILASREQYCVHPKVSTQANKNIECKRLLEKKQKACVYKEMKGSSLTGALGLNNAALPGRVWDVEELVDLGKKRISCPYFGARDMLKENEVEIVFCPYNYLLDAGIRESLRINVSNALLIFDEAHNIEDACRSAASLDLNLESIEIVKASSMQALQERSNGAAGEALRNVLKLSTALETWCHEKVGNTPPTAFQRQEIVWRGHEIVEELARLPDYPVTSNVVSTLFGFMKVLKEDTAEAGEGASRLPHKTLGDLQSLFRVWTHVFSPNGAPDFRMVLRRYRPFRAQTRSSRRSSRQRTLDNSYARSNDDDFEVELCFWCMNPSLAFAPLQKARAIVLASGTLAPMDSFATELGASFPVRLSAAHVVDIKKQAWIGALSKGIRRGTLNASYKSTESFVFQDELVETICAFAKTIPNGLLVFLPSYSLLAKLMRRWESTKALARLDKLKKVHQEPRGSGDFEAALSAFERDARRGCGAVLFAVFRGKVSEGMDFADENARGVLLVGIPYPNVQDLGVKLKREFNDMQRHASMQVGGNSKSHVLSGSDWYTLQAYRALNQALGRCIRHREDYGTIVLLDSRHLSGRTGDRLSKWAGACLRYYDNFTPAIESVQRFCALDRSAVAPASGVVSSAPSSIPSVPSSMPSVPSQLTVTEPTTPLPTSNVASSVGVVEASLMLDTIDDAQVVQFLPGGPPPTFLEAINESAAEVQLPPMSQPVPLRASRTAPGGMSWMHCSMCNTCLGLIDGEAIQSAPVNFLFVRKMLGCVCTVPCDGDCAIPDDVSLYVAQRGLLDVEGEASQSIVRWPSETSLRQRGRNSTAITVLYEESVCAAYCVVCCATCHQLYHNEECVPIGIDVKGVEGSLWLFAQRTHAVE